MDGLHLYPDPEPTVDALVGRLARRRFLHEYDDDLDAAVGAARRQVERVGDRGGLWQVRDGERVVGEVWLVRGGDEERAVLDVVLDDAVPVHRVRDRVVDLARAEGAARLTVTCSSTDAVAGALVSGGGFELSATQMLLPLDDRLTRAEASAPVSLQPMDDRAFEAWVDDEVESYAAERARAGESLERAREVSREQHAELLPDGLATEHHHLFVVRVGDDAVGTMWIETSRPMAFVYDVEIDEQYRRRGHGEAAMRAGAQWAHDHGSTALGLNVFAHNRAARALYDRLGYVVTEDFWGRRL